MRSARGRASLRGDPVRSLWISSRSAHDARAKPLECITQILRATERSARRALEPRLKITSYPLVITTSRQSCRQALETFFDPLLLVALRRKRRASIFRTRGQLRVGGVDFRLNGPPTGGSLQHMRPPRRNPPEDAPQQAPVV